MTELSEKAKSKAQQRFFGMVRAAQKGEMKNPSKEVLDVADDISVKDAKDFAKTKHKGLPAKVKEEYVIEKEDSPYEKASSGALSGKTRSSGASKTEPKTGFGRKAHRNSAAMIIRAKRKAERSGKKLSDDAAADLAHKGWASSVKHHKSSMTPEQQKRRQKLADTPYKKLTKDEQDKDKVSAKAIMSVHDNQKKKTVKEEKKGRHPRDQKELDKAQEYIKKNPNFGKKEVEVNEILTHMLPSLGANAIRNIPKAIESGKNAVNTARKVHKALKVAKKVAPYVAPVTLAGLAVAKNLPKKKKEVEEQKGVEYDFSAPGTTAVQFRKSIGSGTGGGSQVKVSHSGSEIYKRTTTNPTVVKTPAKTAVATAEKEFNAEGASIIQGSRSSKKSSYRGATGDHKRDKDGTISASFYDKKPAPTGEKWGDKSGRPKKPSGLEVRARRKKRREEKAAKAAGSVVQTKSGKKVNSKYEELKAKIYARDEAQSKKSREHAKKNNPNYGKSHGGRKYVYTSVNEESVALAANTRIKNEKQRKKDQAKLAKLTHIYKGMKTGQYNSYQLEGDPIEEGRLDRIMNTVRAYSKKRKADAKKKPTMDSTTQKLHKWRTDKEKDEKRKYVNDIFQ